MAASTALDYNAAWSHPRLDTDAGQVDLDVWQRVIDTNTRGALLLARHAIPHMVERGGGAIVNISSGTSTIGESTRVAYGVSKAGINQLTRHLATRYGRDGIRANTVAPGFILTDTAQANVPAEIQEALGLSPTRCDAWAGPTMSPRSSPSCAATTPRTHQRSR